MVREFSEADTGLFGFEAYNSWLQIPTGSPWLRECIGYGAPEGRAEALELKLLEDISPEV